jgi:hypothetical protein
MEASLHLIDAAFEIETVESDSDEGRSAFYSVWRKRASLEHKK